MLRVQLWKLERWNMNRLQFHTAKNLGENLTRTTESLPKNPLTRVIFTSSLPTKCIKLKTFFLFKHCHYKVICTTPFLQGWCKIKSRLVGATWPAILLSMRHQHDFLIHTQKKRDTTTHLHKITHVQRKMYMCVNLCKCIGAPFRMCLWVCVCK